MKYRNFLVSVAMTLGTMSICAAEFVCKGERIEKGYSTWGYARPTGSDYRIEKGANTIGWVKKVGSSWRIETAGSSTLGWLDNAIIETPAGYTWVPLSDAISLADCSAPLAAGLWILKQHELMMKR